MTPERHHGEGGRYELRDGERVRVDEPQKHHPEGDRARDERGRPVDLPLDRVEPALPAPLRAPWAGPTTAPADSSATKTRKGV